jgi:SNF2 family DNA or RNA helicase
MKILEDKRAVVFKLRNPAKIIDVIPTAKLANAKGTQVVAVPHRPDETRVLRNMGYDIPDPMPMYYQWPGRFAPFDAQRQSSTFLAMNNRAFLLNSMGLGKTLTMLWSYDYLRQTKVVKRALVVCPLSVMERTWADEIFRTFPHLEFSVLYGSKDKRLKLLDQKSDLYIVNFDGLKIVRDALATRDDIDLVIVDELAMVRNASTERWRVLNTICNKQIPRRVWGATGAPTPNLPTDAWAQCRLVMPDSPTVPKYFTKFRDSVMRQLTQYKWVPRDNALDIVAEAMQPAIRFKLDDCVDLPEQIYTTRDVELTPEQEKAYKEMFSQLATEYKGGHILAANEAVKANKLVQIACGVAYGATGDVIIPAKPRVEVLREIIEESEGKVLVFVPLTGVLEYLKKDLEKDWPVEAVHGGTSKSDRDAIFGRFQSTADPHILIANPGTMSHGLTLTAATTIVWFAPIHSNEIYGQANARVRRPGQTRTTVIAHIAATEVERRIYERLLNKESTQSVLLEMMQEMSEAPLRTPYTPANINTKVLT